VYKVVSVLTDDQEIVEDIVQEAFFKAFKNINKLRDSNKFRSWLTAIAVNLCKSYCRKNKREVPAHSHLEYGYDLSPEERFLETEAEIGALQNLEYQDKEILLLKYYYSFSSREIANYYKISVKNVNVKIFRAKERFKRNYETFQEGGLDNVQS
jgi:RNA polymerase sigma-70 factor (ECF subfamily)